MKKWKTSLILLLVFALLAGFCGCRTSDDRYTAIYEEIDRLQKERKKLTDERDAVVYEEEGKEKASFVICFDTADSSVYSTAYALMREYGFPGVVALGADTVLGEGNNMTKEQLSVLLGNGWELALADRGEGVPFADAAELSSYIKGFFDAAEDDTLPRPTTFCFSEGNYRKEFDAVLAENGFSVLRHFGEEKEPIISIGFSSKPWRVGSDRVRAAQSSARLTVERAITRKGTVAVSVGRVAENVEDASVDCSLIKFESMLDSLDGYVTHDLIIPSVFSTAYARKAEAEADREADEAIYLGKLAEIDGKIAAIDAEIAALMKKTVE